MHGRTITETASIPILQEPTYPKVSQINKNAKTISDLDEDEKEEYQDLE
jgi:hypothetical protein